MLKRHLVFVYGTLKRGCGNHTCIRDGHSIFRGTATIRGLLFHLGPFPAASLDEATSEVHGEVWDVDETTMALLDRLEGIPDHYQRQQVETTWGKAWIYTQARENFREGMHVIPTGIWIGGGSPRLHWLGWGKGYVIGSMTEPMREPPATPAQSPWRLVPIDDKQGWMKLINTHTLQIEGRYRYVGDLIRHIQATNLQKKYPPVERKDPPPIGFLPPPVVEKKHSINDLGIKIEQVPKE